VCFGELCDRAFTVPLAPWLRWGIARLRFMGLGALESEPWVMLPSGTLGIRPLRLWAHAGRSGFELPPSRRTSHLEALGVPREAVRVLVLS
jgi:hypothetical protein